MFVAAFTPEQTANLNLVEREARNAFGSVASQLANRKAHPSYGYTKAGIRSTFDRAVGLAQAAAILAENGTTDAAGISYAQHVLGIDVRGLSAAIKAA